METDAPYLAPVPHRGARNEPAWVVETLAHLAEIRGVSGDALIAQVAANLHALLNVPEPDAPAHRAGDRVDT